MLEKSSLLQENLQTWIYNFGMIPDNNIKTLVLYTLLSEVFPSS